MEKIIKSSVNYWQELFYTQKYSEEHIVDFSQSRYYFCYVIQYNYQETTAINTPVSLTLY